MKDEEIKKNVVDELYWDDRIDASKVQASVADRTVRLEGTVPTYRSKILATKDAWNVSGVKWVENNLVVKYGVEVPTDEDIVRRINNRFMWNQYLHPEKLEIISSQGDVVLKGAVDAIWKKETAESEAEAVAGVRAIDNKITIVPSHKASDREIAENIAGVLGRRAFVSRDDVDVKVEDGVVTLSGKVSSWMAYHMATSAAHYTAGVKDVKNQLKIK